MIQDYIRQFNPHAAMKVASAIVSTGDGLTSFPYRGRSVGRTGMREVTMA
jgi:plasmid stabilization system protein ParE